MWYAADQDYGRKLSICTVLRHCHSHHHGEFAISRRNDSPVLMLHQLRDIRRRTWTLRFSPVLTNFAQGDLSQMRPR